LLMSSFFFQAEDGIRDLTVTGVQTCALPIYSSVEKMLASTDRGLLVTRLWYIREVDPYEKVMTGMTRDGLFLVENGTVTGAVKNFRFNQSLIEMLKKVELMSPAVRATGEESFEMVVPAMMVRDFHFSEVTKF